MTLAKLRLLIATAACAALAAPALAQDEDPADAPDETGEADVLAEPPVYDVYGVAPPADLDLYAPPSGLEVLLMSREQMISEADAVVAQLEVCEARFEESQTHLAEVPEEVELVYALPLFGGDAAALLELEAAAAAAEAAALAAAEAEAAAAENGEGEGESEDDGSEAAPDEAPAEELPLAPPTAPGAEAVETEEAAPAEAPTFGLADVLNDYDEVIGVRFTVHPLWTAELLGCGIEVDGAAGHLNREANRRGETLPALDAASDAIAAHLAASFLILPQREIPPPLPPEEEEAAEAAEDGEDGEAAEGEDVDGEDTEGDADGEDADAEDGDGEE